MLKPDFYSMIGDSFHSSGLRCDPQVARDIATLQSVQVPALAPESSAELEKHRQGIERQAQRTASRGDGGGGEATASAAKDSPPDAELVSLRRMHWQDRNTQGRVFGGAPLQDT